MTTNKLTNKVALSLALNALSTYSEDDFNGFNKADVLAKIDAMMNQLDKRTTSDKPKAPTENQKQNEGFKAEILTYLADGSRRTATDIQKHIASATGEMIANQRVSAILRQMRLDGKIDKATEKGKTMFYTL